MRSIGSTEGGVEFADGGCSDEAGNQGRDCACRFGTPMKRVSGARIQSSACFCLLFTGEAPCRTRLWPCPPPPAHTDERRKRRRSGPLPLRRMSASAPGLDASGLERHQDVEELLAVARLLDVHELAVAAVGDARLCDLVERDGVDGADVLGPDDA